MQLIQNKYWHNKYFFFKLISKTKFCYKSIMKMLHMYITKMYILSVLLYTKHFQTTFEVNWKRKFPSTKTWLQLIFPIPQNRNVQIPSKLAAIAHFPWWQVFAIKNQVLVKSEHKLLAVASLSLFFKERRGNSLAHEHYTS